MLKYALSALSHARQLQSGISPKVWEGGGGGVAVLVSNEEGTAADVERVTESVLTSLSSSFFSATFSAATKALLLLVVVLVVGLKR